MHTGTTQTPKRTSTKAAQGENKSTTKPPLEHDYISAAGDFKMTQLLTQRVSNSVNQPKIGSYIWP